MADIDIKDSPFAQSPVVPKLYNGDKVINFRCYKGIGCFNACCSNIDITLTPYDIIRLKNRLGVPSGEFLRDYTVPFEMEKDGIAGVKFRPVEGGTACRFMTDEGCSVYEDRPTACRYYPVALVAMRKQDEYTDSNSYAVVQEEHCFGHQEERSLTIDEYREEQGLPEYDEQARGWRQLILKKKSSGPAIGKPSQRSLRLFFTANYDIDSFRVFVNSEGFRQSFDIDDEMLARLNADDVELLHFGQRLLGQVLFGEQNIPLRTEAQEAWEARRREELAAQQEAEEANRPDYDPALEPVDLL